MWLNTVQYEVSNEICGQNNFFNVGMFSGTKFKILLTTYLTGSIYNNLVHFYLSVFITLQYITKLYRPKVYFIFIPLLNIGLICIFVSKIPVFNKLIDNIQYPEIL